jgi:hypothetical protein
LTRRANHRHHSIVAQFVRPPTATPIGLSARLRAQLEREDFPAHHECFSNNRQAVQHPCASVQLFRDTILRCISSFQVAAQAGLPGSVFNNRPIAQGPQQRCLLACSRRSLYLIHRLLASVHRVLLTARSIRFLCTLNPFGSAIARYRERLRLIECDVTVIRNCRLLRSASTCTV